ncbi:hypothetical protein BP5796_07595 [Coleophoma crateriformis]|uniref:Zn(2)-C6 fungal-type domain-containing protein n=1 Tax=Coleophoma crateriformis TaxID=565419 RepID=A0A3D8RJC6_9HELO|nr:hypothetical protein BP5796_07595 [Coleophoma crateriformis]
MPEKRRALSRPPEDGEDHDGPTNTEARLASCEECKARKLKCDRRQPSCVRCQRSGADCVYHERRKPGFQAGFRQTMEERLSRVEQELYQLKQQNQSPAEASERSRSTNTINTFTATPATVKPSLSVQTESIPNFSPILWTKTGDVGEKCPPADLVYSTAALYFRHIHPWFPVLSPERVFNSLVNTEALDEPSLLHYAIFGISVAFSNEPRLDRDSADSYCKYCKRKIMLEMLEDPSYDALEAMTILTLDLSSMTNGPQVWGAQALIVNLALQLGLADESDTKLSDRQDEITKIGEDLRRRLFWGVYMVDRFITLATPHPCRMDESLVHRYLPRQTRSTHAPSKTNSMPGPLATSQFGDNIELFDHRLGLMAISSKVHTIHLQYTSLAANDSSSVWLAEAHQGNYLLAQWYGYLPPRFTLRNDVYDTWKYAPWDPTFLMLHVAYHGLEVYLNGPLVYPFHGTHTVQGRGQILQQVIASNQMMGKLLATAYEKGFITAVGWPFAWNLWTAARFQLVHEFQAKIPFSPLLRQLHEGLRHIARYWQISGKYWRLLDRAVTEAEALNLQGVPPSRVQGRSALSSVTDLRVSPYELVDQFGTRPSPTAPSSTAAATEAVTTRSSEKQTRAVDFSGNEANIDSCADQSYFTYQTQSQGVYDWFDVQQYPAPGYQ